MKKRFNVFAVAVVGGILVLGTFIALMIAYAPERPATTEFVGGTVTEVTHKGHVYLSFDGSSYNGGVVHSESCPCKSK
jgi:hypothetical protein